jgi:antitoxin component of RelBE/YafQ-DinJ toxin-antitoxin module
MSSGAISPSIQIKITLPLQLQEFVQSKADKFGLSVATYIRHLVLDDVKDMDMPVFKMSEKTEKNVLKALKEHTQGKTHQIDDIEEFVADL